MKVILIFLLITSLFSQAKEKKSGEPRKAYLAVIAVGAKPSVKYEMLSKRNTSVGVSRRMKILENANQLNSKELAKLADTAMIKPIEKGQKPPSVLYLKGEKGKELRLNVGFNKGMPFSVVPAAKVLDFKCSALGDSSKKKYLKLAPLLPGSRNIVILKPSSKAPKNWQGKAKYDFINLDSINDKGRKVIAINRSTKALKMTLGTQVFILQAGAKMSLPLDESNQKYLQFRVTSLRKPNDLLARGSVPLSDTALNLYVFYRANRQTNHGKSLGVFRKILPLPEKLKELD